ncbi:MAG: hypothetical protein PHC66_03520 [Candidatus Nanoarchaeia archaeon]|nr:hypothetical protein [Candidatus Nanoarchaeia archaeon]MDD5239805.1 hypothetical protein [Candidatus Nanoarchaeia archaeon]
METYETEMDDFRKFVKANESYVRAEIDSMVDYVSHYGLHLGKTKEDKKLEDLWKDELSEIEEEIAKEDEESEKPPSIKPKVGVAVSTILLILGSIFGGLAYHKWNTKEQDYRHFAWKISDVVADNSSETAVVYFSDHGEEKVRHAQFTNDTEFSICPTYKNISESCGGGIYGLIQLEKRIDQMYSDGCISFEEKCELSGDRENAYLMIDLNPKNKEQIKKMSVHFFGGYCEDLNNARSEHNTKLYNEEVEKQTTTLMLAGLGICSLSLGTLVLGYNLGVRNTFQKFNEYKRRMNKTKKPDITEERIRSNETIGCLEYETPEIKKKTKKLRK